MLHPFTSQRRQRQQDAGQGGVHSRGAQQLQMGGRRTDHSAPSNGGAGAVRGRVTLRAGALALGAHAAATVSANNTRHVLLAKQRCSGNTW